MRNISKYQEGLVSVITPAYNAYPFLDEAIESVKSQSYNNWEMLVIDDCSEDATRNIVLKHAERDDRIKYLYNNSNNGTAVARNKGLEKAIGQYIAFLDSDDTWLPDKLKIQLEYMNKNNIEFSYTEYRRISENGDRLGKIIHVPDMIGYHDLIKNTAIPTSTVMLDRSMIGDIKMTETHHDDFVLWLEIIKRGFTAHGLRADLMRYRDVEDSLSSNKIHSAYKVWRTYRDIEHITMIPAIWYFTNYAWNAVKKHMRF